MIKKIFSLTLVLALSALIVSCGSSSKEKELKAKIAELEQKVTAQAKPTSNTNTPEAEVKPEGPLPVFSFEEEVYDFGTINEGDIVEKIFTFKNMGEAPLIIADAKGSCGCTVPEYSKDVPIPINGEGTIKVVFNSKGKPGIQNKTVTITANTYPKITRLRIKANVTKKEENPS